MSGEAPPHYRRPGWLTKHVFNPMVAGLIRVGVNVWGSRVLEVRGRKSGRPQRVPVNLLTHEGRSYLVSARGEGQWVRNVRAAGGEIVLCRGRHRDPYGAVELPDESKPPVLRAYLRRWKAEVGAFFEGVDANSSDDEVRRIAPKHPVFVVEPRPAATTDPVDTTG